MPHPERDPSVGRPLAELRAGPTRRCSGAFAPRGDPLALLTMPRRPREKFPEEPPRWASSRCPALRKGQVLAFHPRAARRSPVGLRACALHPLGRFQVRLGRLSRNPISQACLGVCEIHLRPAHVRRNGVPAPSAKEPGHLRPPRYHGQELSRLR